MNIHFQTLILQCKGSKEVIDLSAQVSFFHGKVSSGKSSITRLINYCLGGNLERTPAIVKEVISVALELTIGEYHVLLERFTQSESMINATCVDIENKSFSISVPSSGEQKPVWEGTVYNISDLIFHLQNINIIRVPASRHAETSNLVRLSFRNFMWFCYLDQSKLDNSFYRLEDPTKSRNSKEVLKYILQYSTQKLIELEEQVHKYKRQRLNDTATIEGLRAFLKNFGFSTEEQIQLLIDNTRRKYLKAKQDKQQLEDTYKADTHESDALRLSIKDLIQRITIRENSINDLEETILEQDSLKSELVASKFKFSKSKSAASILQGVKFYNCPCCGTDIENRVETAETCVLCLSPIGSDKPMVSAQSELIQADLNDRIKELDNSIDLHKKWLSKARKELISFNAQRRELDSKLEFELKQYESVFLSRIRSHDQEVAKLQERIKGFDRLKRMPKEISRLEINAADLLKKENLLKSQISIEKQKFVKGEEIIKDLEATFLKALLEVGIPGIKDSDKIYINRKTFETLVLPEGEDYLAWNFYNAGSGGKKTLFNSCFMLALHEVASRHELPLPNFILIDTPMKNIDKEVNQDIFRNFFNYLYSLAMGPLDNTQFIIIDNNFIPPSTDTKINFYHRYMANEDSANPPLISYYVGP